MAKKICKSCGKKEAIFPHNNGGWVCEKCIGKYFQCPDCGGIFDMDDYENGDAHLTGKCKACEANEK